MEGGFLSHCSIIDNEVALRELEFPTLYSWWLLLKSKATAVDKGLDVGQVSQLGWSLAELCRWGTLGIMIPQVALT